MSQARGSAPGTLDLLDEGVERMTRAWGAVGAFWLMALPGRLVLAELLVLAAGLGRDARNAGHLLLERSYLVLALGLATVYGRVVLARACVARPAVRNGGWAVLRVPLQDLARSYTSTLAVLLVAAALSVTIAVPLVLLPALGLAAIAPGLSGRPAPLLESTRVSLLAAPRRLLGLHLLLLLGAVAVGVNLHLTIDLVATAVGAVVPGQAQALSRALTLENPRYLGLLLAGVSLCLEPFWLAALTVHAEALRARGSGDDLRVWLDELRARGARRVA